ncbi:MULTISPECIES: alpha/beta fold hydrolase [Brevibacillus]|uniref:alpha/beta fold hydrolase n=1 Tax=Brevibacillus TaxID=55080 RepID=UPI000D0EB9C2|nr:MULTISPECIES: alpha/beta hydrolase [Brevibacillus]PSJ70477.1 alpha/beta hydrolase [Brevibacillus brevis]RED30807.1 pimeloyl-ACP methyl ester carboxylesterase [Brevibacillus brevis]TQK63236.1 pimeloyl-ACP methyl ester carboxylesterase [Brevibacillus sp. AG162]VEF89979.1 acetoin dehydrogenase E2 subunit dihydrolipoyllysine-residue acetyltransferase [Brevibacillus brevis]GEC88935.1 alpha/beta hydrolase [Brevibacillus brevis]
MSDIGINETSQKLDIGGVRLCFKYFGEISDFPTVVFDSGYGCTLNYWSSIGGDISKHTRMFIYDRAGIGESESDERPRHSQQIIENLRSLLQKANVSPPYVLVGHSFGGLNVRLYASTFPEEVAGVILLDPCHEDQNKVMVPLFSEEIQAAYYSQFVLEGSIQEMEESFEQARNSKSLGNKPLIVVSGTLQSHHNPESMAAWVHLHKELTKLSTRSKHIIVENAGHAIHIDQPDVVVDIIKDMLLSCKAQNN